jgi:hypothetical protein
MHPPKIHVGQPPSAARSSEARQPRFSPDRKLDGAIIAEVYRTKAKKTRIKQPRTM